MKEMRSIVYCPVCGREARVDLKEMEGEMMEFAMRLSRGLGLGVEESDRYCSERNRCECGKYIAVSMTVTAEN